MKILFFDGYCSLCNGLVDWLIKIDKQGTLQFASLQGESAQKILGVLPQNFETVIYVSGQKKHTRSTAILMALSDLSGPWFLVKMFFIIPQFLRDFFYQLIAKNRYRLFGLRKTCRVPTIVERGRLLP